jgi:hypothetical protein
MPQLDLLILSLLARQGGLTSPVKDTVFESVLPGVATLTLPVVAPVRTVVLIFDRAKNSCVRYHHSLGNCATNYRRLR